MDARTREQQRSRRKRPVRGRTESMKRMTVAQRLRMLRETDYPEGVWRPRTRGDCAHMGRPCPFVSCIWNLYLDVSPRTGSVKLNFPDLEVWEMPPMASCALDVADRGGTTLEDLGAIMNLTRERIRQLEVRALVKCLNRADLVDEEPAHKLAACPSESLDGAVRNASGRVREVLEYQSCTFEELSEIVYGNAARRSRQRLRMVLSNLMRTGEVHAVDGVFMLREAAE